MQDIRQTFGLSPEDETQVRNRAAVALAEAMHRARSQQADHDSVKFEARAISVARLEALRKKLAPLYSAIPRDVELFDLGLVANERPRLFVDIIAFIEMNRDQTGYRFLQETRSGRVMLAETADDAEIVERVTEYVARRLIERERALAADAAFGAPVPEPAATSPVEVPAVAPDLVEPEEVTGDAKVQAGPAEPASPIVAMPRALPMTAEEAFRQWSSAPKQAMHDSIKEPDVAAPAPEKVTLADTTTTAVDIHPIDRPAPAASYIDPITGAPIALGESTRSPTVESIDKTAAEIEKAVERIAEKPQRADIPSVAASLKPAVAAATVAAAASTAASRGATTQTAAAPVRNSGWWLWPILALLIGAGMGALGLYLWAASMMR